MAWSRKKKEDKVVDVKEQDVYVSVDPRVQQFKNDEDRVKSQVEAAKPVVEEEVKELVDDVWYVFSLKVPMSGAMYKRLQKMGESRGFVDEGELVREALRRTLW